MIRIDKSNFYLKIKDVVCKYQYFPVFINFTFTTFLKNKLIIYLSTFLNTMTDLLSFV
jgi:hypothetical protein